MPVIETQPVVNKQLSLDLLFFMFSLDCEVSSEYNKLLWKGIVKHVMYWSHQIVKELQRSCLLVAFPWFTEFHEMCNLKSKEQCPSASCTKACYTGIQRQKM